MLRSRANRVLRQLTRTGGRCLLFSLGHFLRILTARWLGLASAHGRPFVLDTGAVSVLGHEHGCPVIRAGNLAAPRCGRPARSKMPKPRIRTNGKRRAAAKAGYPERRRLSEL